MTRPAALAFTLLALLVLVGCDGSSTDGSGGGQQLELELSYRLALEERGTTGYDLVETDEGDFLLLGNVRSSESMFFEHAFLQKITSSGELLWRRMLYDAFFTKGFELASCADGGTLAVGELRRDDLLPSEMFMARHDAAGEKLWSAEFGDVRNDGARACMESSAGNLVAVGFTESKTGEQLPWAVSLASDGALQWQIVGPKHSDGIAYSVSECNNGDYIIGGGGSTAAFLWRVSKTGETLWYREVFGVLGATLRGAVNIAGGDFVFTGVLMTGNNSGKLLLGRSNPDGEIRWFQALGSGFNMDVGSSLREHPDGGFFVAGSTTSNSRYDAAYWLLHFDLEGLLLWDASYELPYYSWCHAGELSTTGGFAAIGFSLDYENPSELWFVLTEPYSPPASGR